VKPFAPRPYRELPAKPRIPHDFDRCDTEELTLESAPFGRIRVHVRSMGAGPPLLLVHGLMTSSYSWRYLFAPLSKHFRVIAPDLPGAGRTEPKPAHSHSARALATFLGELQEKLGIVGCAAVGNSLGGYLCLQRAIADERAFEKLVVVHAPAFADLRIRALHTLLGLPGTRAALRWAIHRDPMKWAFRNVHYRDESLKSQEEAREYGAPLSTPEGAADFARWLHDAVDPTELAAFGEALRLRAPEIPLLLLYAREDPMVPPSVGPRLAALLPRARFEWMDDTSHFAHVDTPQVVLDRLLPFLGD
jgi:pimeloyl-ACP methyl ester carboxylesterase